MRKRRETRSSRSLVKVWKLLRPRPYQIHGGVGLAQQRVGVVAVVRRHGDADRHAQEQLLPVDMERRADGRQDALGHAARARAVERLQHDDEFVAAQAGHGVGLAGAGLQAGGHLAQELVAELVAQRVVDVLEAVQVEEHHGHARAVAPRQRQRVLQPVFQRAAVQQAGQRIVRTRWRMRCCASRICVMSTSDTSTA